ncbi:MAG: PD40 domain-containing protein [Bacteroidetes bacterium]|nr:PD40 domain-containing protein [Bacteroidota bacterium]
MKIKNFPLLIFILMLVCTFIFPDLSHGQFGQNKVQYKEFKWKYIQSKHFDIYFSQGGEKLAQFTANVAENSLKNLTENLDYNIVNRIPVIVYNSHNDFQQNNVIDEYLPEGVGGVTELFKNRVNVPFEGDYEKFRHVIHHELLHAFMNEMFYGGSVQNIISRNITLSFPLWFSEGMAEVQSLYGLNKETDMFMRDASINNYVPPLENIGGYFAYRGGQSFFAFLADTYGEDKLGLLMNNIKTFGDVDQGFKETFKTDIEKLDEKWQKYLKKTYWPDLKIREDVKDFSKQLTDHEKDGGYYNVAPAISPDGSKFAFISNKDDLFDVFIANTKNGKIIKKLIAGNNSTDFEELHILTPSLTWSPDGRKLAITAKAGDRDVIYIVDVNSEDKSILPLNFNTIYYVSWSPVDDNIAFIGANGDRSNLYVYNLKKKKLETLTDDIFSDANPSWSPDGKKIFFTSDRSGYTDPATIPADLKMWNYDYSNTDFYSIDLQTRKIERLSDLKYSKESYAQSSSDGKKLIYLSDKNGITNIYLREIDSSGNFTERPITNALNPIDQLSLSKDGQKLLFVSLNKGGYDIFSMDNPLKRDIGLKELELTDYQKKSREYDLKFGRKLFSADESVPLLTDSLKTALRNNALSDLSDTLTNNSEKNFADSSGNSAFKDSLNSDLSLPDSGNMVSESNVNKETDSSKYYGEDVKISFETPEIKRPGIDDSSYADNVNFKVTDNQNSDGSYKIKNYKIKFSPDLVYGNANYASFYGVQGVAQVVLSDMLGNHRIYIQTSLVIDLKNSDYAVAYYYLPKRIDYGFQLYHTARFLNYGSIFNNYLFRYRTFGGSVSASYPISRFKRIESNLSVEHISRENLDVASEPINTKTLIVPSASLVHDNTVFGYTAPVSGTRYNFTLFGSPKLGSDGIGFGSLLGDFRHYIKLGEDYSFAARLSGGASFGPNPQRFFIGGTENWINREFENYSLPVSNIEEYAFSSPGLPLRGFNYDRMSGSKYSILNLELRFPLLKYLIFGALPLGFANIEGVAFVDAGSAWSDTKSLKLISRDSNGKVKTNDLLLGTGLGARANLFGFPVMFDLAWSYDLNKFSSPKYYISFGYDF